MTTADGTLFVLSEPIRNVVEMASMAANLAPKVHSFNRELTYSTSRSMFFAALAEGSEHAGLARSTIRAE